ncbi:hypothetical protein NliqN6_2283 [Naganishia liquefaciens]|uniref:Uncharacterized protein n=1 Tax=Naganishia liquefaciens TaxID=104408 RepID=A0A8H3TRZ0_9TREE|nr:hypothetical protein NliqN6_2283 [Naganishia liquefaciens]
MYSRLQGKASPELTASSVIGTKPPARLVQPPRSALLRIAHVYTSRFRKPRTMALFPEKHKAQARPRITSALHAMSHLEGFSRSSGGWQRVL